MKLRFTVEGAPVGKGRPEAVVIRVRGRHVAKLHTPTKTRHYEAHVAQAGLDALAEPSRRFPYSGPVGLMARIYHPFAPGKRPDGDNVLKAILDGLTGHIYSDDRQVQMGAFVVSIDPDRPRVEVAVESLPTACCILCGHPITPSEVP